MLKRKKEQGQKLPGLSVVNVLWRLPCAAFAHTGRTVYLLNIAIRATLSGFVVGCPACKQVRGNRLVLPLTPAPHSWAGNGFTTWVLCHSSRRSRRERHEKEIGENAVQTRTDCALPVLQNGLYTGFIKETPGLFSVWR